MAASAVLTAAAVLAGVGIGYAVWEPNVHTEPASHVSPVTPRTGTTRAGFSTTTTSTKTTTRSGSPKDDATIAAKIDPTLVDINTVLGDETAEAAGTGMVLTSTGKVLTNNHVIEGSTSISVTDLGNGETYSASVLGYDRTQDVAVIQLKGASGLKVANFGNSSTVTIGEAVVGIGNAGGTGGTPSRAGGSVTALGQAITASDEGSQTTEHLTNLIETNCDIEPGDSGGPLVNTSDQIVGMDTAASAAQGFSFSGAATGQGYSIPINTALTIAKQIEAGKSSATVHLGQTPFLGVEVESAPSTGSSTNPFGRLGFGSRTPTATPRTFGTSTTKSSTTTTPTQSATGVLVAGVLNNTAALKAGLVKGDYITAVGSTKVSSPDALTKAIEQYKVGTTVKITWTDTAGQTQTATVTFTAGPAG